MKEEIVALRSAAEIVLENSAFIFVEELEPWDSEQIDAWAGTAVYIDYHGAASGRVELFAEPGFAQLVAQNMLGIESDDPQIALRANDALQESLNMLCGYFLTEFYGADLVFSMGMPTSDTTLSLRDSATKAGIWLDAEGLGIFLCHQVNHA